MKGPYIELQLKKNDEKMTKNCIFSGYFAPEFFFKGTYQGIEMFIY